MMQRMKEVIKVKERLMVVASLVIIMLTLSGCLVQDDSKTMMGSEEKADVKEKATEITNNFFKYNSYDQDTDSNYNAQGLIDLFKQDVTGDIVTIDPIIGGQYGKSLTTLKEELYAKETLFEAFEAQLDNDKFNYNSYKLTFDSKTIFVDNNIQEYTARYSVQFQVFETINGEKIPTPEGVPEGVTDNGVITFELVNENQGWKIEWIKIDFQEIGNISLN